MMRTINIVSSILPSNFLFFMLFNGLEQPTGLRVPMYGPGAFLDALITILIPAGPPSLVPLCLLHETHNIPNVEAPCTRKDDSSSISASCYQLVCHKG